MIETCSTINPPEISERAGEPEWFINFDKDKDIFYIKSKIESDWAYNVFFYNEVEALDYFCTHREEFAKIHDDIKRSTGIDLILKYSFNRYVIFKYSLFDINSMDI